MLTETPRTRGYRFDLTATVIICVAQYQRTVKEPICNVVCQNLHWVDMETQKCVRFWCRYFPCIQDVWGSNGNTFVL